MRESDDDTLVGDEILDRHVALVGNNVGAARRGVLVPDLRQVVLDDGQHTVFAGNDVHQVLDLNKQLVVLGLDLALLQTGQLVEAQVKNGVHLCLAEQIITALDAFLVADLDAPLLQRLLREFERQQFYPGFLAVA